MALYLIGLGLNDEKDITLRGLEAVKKCDFVYLENYTSLINVSVAKLEDLYKKKIISVEREFIENKTDEIIKKASENNVAILVIGDSLSATTHITLYLEAIKKGIACYYIPNASIFSAVAVTGLQLYKFGATASIPFFKSNTPYEILKNNKEKGYHTLFLLDLDPKEDRFMTINEAINILINLGKQDNGKVFSKTTMVLGCSALGSDNFEIKYGKALDIKNYKFTRYPQSLIVPGELHFVEQEMLNHFIHLS